MAQKSIVTFIFETGKEPFINIYNKYAEGDAIKGYGTNLVELALDEVTDLLENPLTAERQLPRIKVVKAE